MSSSTALSGAIAVARMIWVLNQNNGKTPQIIHLFIGFSIIFTIHFGVFPLFLETSIWKNVNLCPSTKFFDKDIGGRNLCPSYSQSFATKDIFGW